MTFTSLVAALAALAVSDPAPSAPVGSELVGPTAHAEYFLISEADATGGGIEGAPIAVVALRSIDHSGRGRLAGADVQGVDFLLEREVTFAQGGLRVRHTETGQGATRRLVWREFLPNESRTWIADWTAGVRGASVHSIGYGWNRPVHERVMESEASHTAVYGPLELLYGLRDGHLPCSEAAGTVGALDPASASVVQVSQDSSAGSAIDLRRADGTLLLGADVGTLPGEDASQRFTSLRLSDRVTIARAIGRTEFDRLSRRWTVESRRPYDAVLALIPKPR